MGSSTSILVGAYGYLDRSISRRSHAACKDCNRSSGASHFAEGR